MEMALVGQFPTHFPHPEHESDAMGMLPRDPNIPSSSSVFLAEENRLWIAVLIM